MSGHYLKADGVGNYGSGGVLSSVGAIGDGLYYCRSSASGTANALMGTGGCLMDYNNLGVMTGANINKNYSGTYQRYGEYAIQYMDYNGNNSNDNG